MQPHPSSLGKTASTAAVVDSLASAKLALIVNFFLYGSCSPFLFRRTGVGATTLLTLYQHYDQAAVVPPIKKPGGKPPAPPAPP